MAMDGVQIFGVGGTGGPVVSLRKIGRVYVMTLLGEDDHRFDKGSMNAIIAAIETVHNSEDAGALVTTNEGRFFSNGLSMKFVESRMRSASPTKTEFARLLAIVLNLNVPTIAAINGHASAGGLIFALAHDHRYMRGDRGFLYMSEMDVQVRFLAGIMNIVRSALSPKAFKDVILLAKKQTAAEGLSAGIVDSVHENATSNLQAAIEFATQLTLRNWNRELYRTMRLDLKPGLLASLVDEEAPDIIMHRSRI